MGQHTDVLLIGGGLQNCLLALYASRKHPELNFIILEAEDTLLGGKTISAHHKDVPKPILEMVTPFIKKSWPNYLVSFPNYEKRVGLEYFTLDCVKLGHFLSQNSFSNIQVHLSHKVLDIKNNNVQVEGGRVFSSNLIIDTRPTLKKPASTGIQQFFGIEAYFPDGHNMDTPVLMDALVDQTEGYRFFYLLPFNANTLLVEDTRIAKGAPSRKVCNETSIREYLAKKFPNQVWYSNSHEYGLLPVPTKPQIPSQDSASLFKAGMAAGIFNKATGYSLPLVSQYVLELTPNLKNNPRALETTRVFKARVFRKSYYYLIFNFFLFYCFTPEKAYACFEYFYRHDNSYIIRFYRNELKTLDFLRIFTRKPPSFFSYRKFFLSGIKRLILQGG